MATAVQIELTVDGQGAVQGVRAFDTAVKGSSGSVNQLDSTLQKLNTHLDQLGSRGASAGRQAARGMREVKEEGISTREGIHLVTEEFGIEMPKAFKKLIVDSKAAEMAIKAVGAGIAGIAGFQIGFMLFSQAAEGAEKLWHNVLNVEAAIEDYNAEVEKTKRQDFGNAKTIETTRLRIAEATQEVENYKKAAEALNDKANHSVLHALDPAAPYMTWQAHELNSKAMEAQRQVDQLKNQRQPEQAHRDKLDQIDLEHAADRRLSKEKQITADLDRRLAINAENARYEAEQEGRYGNLTASRDLRTPSPFSLSRPMASPEQATADAKAQAESDAELFNLRREQAQELAHLREQALEAGLRGTALYRAQEAAAIEDLKFKDMDSVAARQAIHQKFHAEELRRLEDQEAQIRKMREETVLGGLTGVARTRQQGVNRINDIASDTKSGLNPGERLSAIHQVNLQTQQTINQEYQTFADRVDGILQQTASRSVSGFAKIHADAEREIHNLEVEGKKSGRPGDVQRGIVGIRSSEADQVAELKRRNLDETEQIEAEARSQSMSAERNQTMAIAAEYAARTQKYRAERDEQLKSDQLTADERESIEEQYNRRVAAAGELQRSQMVEAAKQAREKMAGEFSRFFQNPMSTLKELGNKAAGEAAAAMMQRVQGRFALSGSTRGEGMPGIHDWTQGLFGKIAGAPNPSGFDHKAEVLGRGSNAPQTFSLATAQIHVGSASIAFGGTSGVGSSMPGVGGSTPLLSSGSFGGGTASAGTPSGSFGGGTAAGGSGMMSTFSGATESPTAMPPAAPGGTVGSALSNTQQGFSFFKQAKGIFGAKPGTSAGSDGGGLADVQSMIAPGSFDKNGNFVSGAGKSGGMLSGGGFGANAMGAAGGAMGMYAAFQGNGGVGGALGGAMSGMQLGMALGGPMGAAVGAAAGAIVGAIGFGGREKARVYDLKTVRPRLTADFTGYQQGSTDYSSAYSDMESLDVEARKTLSTMGPAAKAYYWDTVNKEIKQAEAKLTGEQRAGRSKYTATAAQYDQGGWTGNFGAMATGSGSGWAHMRANEFVVHEQPAAEHAGALEAIRAGASSADMARYYGSSSDAVASGYRSAMASSAAQTQVASGDRTLNMHVQAWDSKDVARFFDKHKHTMRSALNSSYGENSGGADA
jgi:hypothetical protein